MDAFTHEHDIRNALSIPGGRESVAASIALEFGVGSWLHYGVTRAGLPKVVVEAGEGRWSAGEGDPVTTLRGEPFEITRAATGRRSIEQIKSLDWSRDPEPYLAAFTWGPFRPAASALAE